LEIAAALLLRDGNAKQRKAHARWARKQCTTATRGSEDPVHRFRTGLRFNPMGIGTLGLVHATLHNKARLAVRGLLELAVRGDPAIAHGFAAARDALNLIDPKLPSAVLRCAFNGVIRPRIRYYDPQPDDEARRVYAVARAKRAVDSEFASLCGKADEPQWPLFERGGPRKLCGGRQSTAGVESDLLAPRCALCDDATLNRFCLHPLTSQPDEAFLDAMSRFLRSLDFLYLTGKGPTTERAVVIRTALVQHFRTTRQFKQLASTTITSSSVTLVRLCRQSSSTAPRSETVPSATCRRKTSENCSPLYPSWRPWRSMAPFWRRDRGVSPSRCSGPSRIFELWHCARRGVDSSLSRRYRILD
jgi:hypothetical protein